MISLLTGMISVIGFLILGYIGLIVLGHVLTAIATLVEVIVGKPK